MRVAIFGGSGFLGRHVVAALVEGGHDVLVVARGSRPAPPGATLVTGDLAQGSLPVDRLRGCDAFVNLAGVKSEHGTQTFEAVHVEGAKRLVAAAREAGVGRIVHVSVVCSRPDPTSPYHDTKWRAEEILRANGKGVTILRPSVIYGRGDDMVTDLVKMIRAAAVFPIVGRGESILQPVDVRDVALAVVSSLERPLTAGRSYDVVSVERMKLRDVVRTVALGMGLPLRIVSTPRPVMRLAVRLMQTLMPEPLTTSAQLRMLEDGLFGDPEPARRDLGLVPRPFTAAAVRDLEDPVGPLFGLSLRLVDRREHALALARHGREIGPALGLMLLAIVLPALLGWAIPGIWPRLAVNALVLVPIALFGVRLPWRELLRVSAGRLAVGLGAAVFLYGASALVARLLLAVPAFAVQIAAVYAWKEAVPAAWVPGLLLLIVAGEEIVWRNAITLPLAGRFGPVPGVLLAASGFALAHLSFGLPALLIAAAGAGAFWSALVVRTRSAIPAFVSHLLFDLTVMFWLPYG